MSRKILWLLLSLIAGSLFADYCGVSYKQYTCDICGERFYASAPIDIEWDNAYFSTPPELIWNGSYMVCYNCKDKYQCRFSEAMQQTADKFIETIKAENEPNRTENIRRNKAEDVNIIKNKIAELQKQLEENTK